MSRQEKLIKEINKETKELILEKINHLKRRLKQYENDILNIYREFETRKEQENWKEINILDFLNEAGYELDIRKSLLVEIDSLEIDILELENGE